MSELSWIEFISGRLPDLWLRTGEHILLTGVSTSIAITIAIPLGILASRHGWLRGPLLGAAGILQTIPSLAMLAILLAVLGKIGALPAVIALTLYALLPIVRNTVTGLEGVSKEVIEAAKGIVTRCPGGDPVSGLRIGASWDLTWTGLWSGLIDDVRVYKGALSPEDIAELAE